MPSISSSPQEEVGQSHLSRHTGLGSEVRGEPSAADARRFSTLGRSATTPSVTSTSTTQSQPHMVSSSLRTSQLPGFGAAGRDFAAQSVPLYGLDPRMPPSVSSRSATTHDTAFMTPAALDWSVSGNPSIGAASGAPPPSYSFDGPTATRMQSSVPMAFERDSSITSPSSLGTPASATPSQLASAVPFNSALATPPSLVDTSDTHLQSSDLASASPAFASIRASVASPPSVVGTDVGTSASDNSPNFGLSRSTRLQLEASFAAKLDDIVADITNLVDNLRKVGSIPTPPVTKVQSDAIRYMAGRLNIPTLIRLFNLVLVNDLVTSLFLAEATSMSDDELLASCTLPFISEWAERALTSHVELLLGEADIPPVHHTPFQQFVALIVAQNLPLDSFLPTFLAEQYPKLPQGDWITIMDRASRTLRGIFNNGSPRARGSVGASEIVQQVLDGYALECYRARTQQRLSGGSLGDDFRPEGGRDGGCTAHGCTTSVPRPSYNSSLPHGMCPPTLEPPPVLSTSAEFDSRIAAAVAAALRVHGISPLPDGSVSPGRRSPHDEPPPSPPRGLDLQNMTQDAVITECMATLLTRPPAWYNCPPAPGRVNSSTSTPVPWKTILHQVCVQLLKGREFKTSSQTFTDPVSMFRSQVSQITRDPRSYRLQRPRFHEAIARLFLTKSVYDSATRKEATSYVMHQLEVVLPKESPRGCFHYSLDAVQQFLLHAMSHVDDTDDDVDASFLQLLHMLDTFYLSQTAEDPYNSFTSMHWQHSVPWVDFVVDLKRVAEMHRYFTRLNASGHQGSAPVNMSNMQVFLRQVTQTLQRCVNEDGNDSVAAELYTLYSTLSLADPQQLIDDLEKRPKLKGACRKPARLAAPSTRDWHRLYASLLSRVRQEEGDH